MGYRSTRQCVDDLRKHGHLIELEQVIDPNLQIAEVQRRVFLNGGPAILFSNVKGCDFPVVSNLFGTIERARFIFRDTIENVRRAIELKIDPAEALKKPGRYWKAPFTAMAMRPRRVRSGPVLEKSASLQQLPQMVSWPDDGGAFITLPQVYSEDVTRPGWQSSNLGMYRVQLSGNDYLPDRQVGLHYQIHRGIGVHHKRALEAGQPFRVNIFVGGAPSMTLSAVMPLPEGMSELTFAGALAGHRIPLCRNSGLPVYADADFVITGVVDPDQLKPEGPFGDHLGYYSLQHDFPVLNVEQVWHRKDAIWPCTVVGRPPQEDTVFGELIHELTGPIIPTVLPGVKGVHAVDAAGVHPLLLAIGSERYTPWHPEQGPQELLTQSNAILGQGQLSLAKYLLIIDEACDRGLDLHDIPKFFERVLERVNWKRDLHFQTCTTMDTLDYSGSGFNQGSRLVIAAAGPATRQLATETPGGFQLPERFSDPQLCMPGVIAVRGPAFHPGQKFAEGTFDRWQDSPAMTGVPLVVVVDDPAFCAQHLNNFLWVVFTRSDPAADVYGAGAFTHNKHWGCRGPLVVDARIKPHHAPPLVEDPQTTTFVDSLASAGRPISKYL